MGTPQKWLACSAISHTGVSCPVWQISTADPHPNMHTIIPQLPHSVDDLICVCRTGRFGKLCNNKVLFRTNHKPSRVEIDAAENGAPRWKYHQNFVDNGYRLVTAAIGMNNKRPSRMCTNFGEFVKQCRLQPFYCAGRAEVHLFILSSNLLEEVIFCHFTMKVFLIIRCLLINHRHKQTATRQRCQFMISDYLEALSAW